MDNDQQKDLLLLEPNNEIVFEGPLKNLMDAYLIISNPDYNRTVQFKIKTTAPKTYFVRPNVGQLKPNESIKVQITLQSFLFEPEKHKFLVQAAYGPDNGGFDPAFWKNVSKSVWNMKLKSLLNVTEGEYGDLKMGKISEAADEIATDDNVGLMMDMENVSDDVVEGKEEKNSGDECERDTKSEDFVAEDQIATKPEQKSGFRRFFYIVSMFIMVAALVAAYYYQNIK